MRCEPSPSPGRELLLKCRGGCLPSQHSQPICHPEVDLQLIQEWVQFIREREPQACRALAKWSWANPPQCARPRPEDTGHGEPGCRPLVTALAQASVSATHAPGLITRGQAATSGQFGSGGGRVWKTPGRLEKLAGGQAGGRRGESTGLARCSPLPALGPAAGERPWGLTASQHCAPPHGPVL